MRIVEKHACVMNIDQILNNRRIHDGNFTVTATKCATCKLCGGLGHLVMVGWLGFNGTFNTE